MSVEAYVWAMKLAPVPANNPATRQVLGVLAEHAHEDGTSSFPCNETIVEFTGLCLRTVRDALRRLEAAQVVRRYEVDGQRAYALALWQVRTDLDEKRLRELVKKNSRTHAGLRSRGGQLLPPSAQDGGQLLPPLEAATASEPSGNRHRTSPKGKSGRAGRQKPPAAVSSVDQQIETALAWLHQHQASFCQRTGYPPGRWQAWLTDAKGELEKTKMLRHFYAERRSLEAV